MQCEKCGTVINADEAHEYAGRTLCEDCVMDAMSPAKTCDPWATYLATRQGEAQLSPGQESLLAIIKERGQITPEDLLAESGLSTADFQREIATLRHMEKLRGALVDGVRMFKPFNAP